MDPASAERLASVDLVTLGRTIRSLRRGKSMTQADLAGDEVTIGYISRIEAGQRRPDVRLVELFAERLGVTIDVLLGGPDASSAPQPPASTLREAEIRIALEEGRSADAQQLAGDLLNSATSGWETRRARVLYAQALESQGHLQDAIAQLEAVAADDGPENIDPQMAIALSRCYREAGDLVRAVDVGETAMTVLKERRLDATDGALQLTVTVAAAYFERGDTDYAVRLCRAACDRAEDAGSPAARAAAYWNASVMESRRGDTVSAVSLAQTALGLLDAAADRRSHARLQGQLGKMLLRLDPPEVDEAVRLLNSAVASVLEVEGPAVDVASFETALARASLLCGEMEAARASAQAAADRLHGIAPLAESTALVVLGEVAMAQGNTRLAKRHYRQAVAVLTGVGADRSAAQVWFDLADRLQAVGDTDSALAAYRSASVSAGLTSSTAAAGMRTS